MSKGEAGVVLFEDRGRRTPEDLRAEAAVLTVGNIDDPHVANWPPEDLPNVIGAQTGDEWQLRVLVDQIARREHRTAGDVWRAVRRQALSLTCRRDFGLLEEAYASVLAKGATLDRNTIREVRDAILNPGDLSVTVVTAARRKSRVTPAYAKDGSVEMQPEVEVEQPQPRTFSEELDIVGNALQHHNQPEVDRRDVIEVQVNAGITDPATLEWYDITTAWLNAEHAPDAAEQRARAAAIEREHTRGKVATSQPPPQRPPRLSAADPGAGRAPRARGAERP
jgi:hypothetical protein